MIDFEPTFIITSSKLGKCNAMLFNVVNIIAEFFQILNSIIQSITIYVVDYFAKYYWIVRMIYIPHKMRSLNVPIFSKGIEIIFSTIRFLRITTLVIPVFHAWRSIANFTFYFISHPAFCFISTSAGAMYRRFVMRMNARKLYVTNWANGCCFHKHNYTIDWITL